MKLSNFAAVTLSIALLLSSAIYAARPVRAQSIGVSPIATTVSGCQVSQAGQWAVCGVGTAAPYTLYASFSGGAYQAIGGGSGVTSFNGRTGAVTLTDADVTGTGLKVSTTVTSTAVSTPQ